MHITFLLPVLNDAHFNKRIQNLKNTGINLEILGFERNHYEGENLNENVTSLGFVKHGKYLERIPKLLKALFFVRRKSINTDILYCFNLETLLIGWFSSLFRSKKIVYDVADIREILIGKKISSSILRIIERFLIKRTEIVVVTAPAYISGYFHGYLDLRNTKFHIIENKVDPESIKNNNIKLSQNVNETNVIKIGYFGVIRCNHSLKLLKKVVNHANGNIRLYIRGIFQDHLGLKKDEILDSKYVEFGGPFVSPDELSNIYNEIDISWTAIYHFKPNVMWSRTNRFYQACYFQRPMITQQGTPDAKQVDKFDIGFSIDLTKPSEALEKILTLNPSLIKKWKLNMINMPENVYTLSDEHKNLVNKLKS